MKVMSDEEKLLILVKKAVSYNQNGDPIRDVMDDSEIADALELLIKLTEIDTLTVSKLRPMCDAPKNKYIQVSLGKSDELSPGYIKNDYLNCRGANYAINAAKGWVPMQIYKPELTGDGEKTAG